MFMFSEFSTDKSVRTCYCGKLYLITPRLRLSVAPSGIAPGSTPQSRATLRIFWTACTLVIEKAVASYLMMVNGETVKGKCQILIERIL